MSRHLLFLASVVAMMAATGNRLSAQVVPHPNQIMGEIRFNNSSPGIRNLLDSSGMTNRQVFARRAGDPNAPRSNTQRAMSVDKYHADYSITLESGEPGMGIPYTVQPHVWLNRDNDRYLFAPIDSAPLVFGAPPLTLNFSECLGVVDVRFVDAGGNRVVIDDLAISANVGGVEQYVALGATPGTSSRFLFLRGDAQYEVRVRKLKFHTGTPSIPLEVADLTNIMVRTACDMFTLVDCVVPIPTSFGSITGIVAMKTVPLLRHIPGDRTLVVADNGPLQASRRFGVQAQPSSGPYGLLNLVPSSFVIPPQGYSVYSEMFFGTGYNFTYFRTPGLGEGSNGSVRVDVGATVNLSGALDMTNGHMRGNIRLVGPPPELNGHPILGDLWRSADSDADHDGIPDVGVFNVPSYVEILGVNRRAEGATYTAAGGLCDASFEGAYHSASAEFSGNYDAVLGSLYSQPALWEPRHLWLRFRNPDENDENAYVEAQLRIADSLAPELTVSESSPANHNVEYCFSEVFIRFRSANAFYSPGVLQSSGSFNGAGLSGHAEYAVFLESGKGTPVTADKAANVGLVRLLLPQGNYPRLDPFVLHPDGTVDNSLAPILDLNVGCRQRIVIDQCLQLAIIVPTCVSTPLISVTSQVRTLCSNRVATVAYQVDGGLAVPVCQNCGPNPLLNFDVPLSSLVGCTDHTLVVTATDDQGNVSTVSSRVRVDFAPPRIQCLADIVAPCANATQVTVTFPVTATDDCTANPSVVCTPPSGSLFPIGVTPVQCAATDECGKQSACTFNVTVQSDELSIERAVMVRWGCGILQCADNLLGPWTDILDASNPYCVPSSQAKKFYRTRN